MGGTGNKWYKLKGDLSIFQKEIVTFFSQGSNVLIFLLLLVFTGLLTWVLPTEWNVLNYGVSSPVPFFSCLRVVVVFFSPALTMRSFADEKRTGTIEVLLSLPISKFRVVFEKFMAYSCILLLYYVCTAVYPVIMYFLTVPKGSIDYGEIIASYVGLWLAGCSFVSIGIWASSLTENVLIALGYGIILSLTLYYGFDLLFDMFNSYSVKYALIKLSAAYHTGAIARGVIDTRDILYFMVVIALFMYLTVKNLGR